MSASTDALVASKQALQSGLASDADKALALIDVALAEEGDEVLGEPEDLGSGIAAEEESDAAVPVADIVGDDAASAPEFDPFASAAPSGDDAPADSDAG